MTKVVLSVDFKAVQITREGAGVLLGLVRRRLKQESRRRIRPDLAAKRAAATQAGIHDVQLESIRRLRHLEDLLLTLLEV